MNDDELKEYLNKIADTEYHKCWKVIRDSGLTFSMFELQLPIEDSFHEAHALSKQITFHLECSCNNNIMKFRYDGLEIEARGHLCKQKNHHHVSIMQRLQAAVQQQTSRPDIKPLELGIQS